MIFNDPLTILFVMKTPTRYSAIYLHYKNPNTYTLQKLCADLLIFLCWIKKDIRN
jgi:hypothetical protein